MLANVQQQVNKHLLEWNNIIDAFRGAVRKQAHSEAEYKHARVMTLRWRRIRLSWLGAVSGLSICVLRRLMSGSRTSFTLRTRQVPDGCL